METHPTFPQIESFAFTCPNCSRAVSFIFLPASDIKCSFCGHAIDIENSAAAKKSVAFAERSWEEKINRAIAFEGADAHLIPPQGGRPLAGPPVIVGRGGLVLPPMKIIERKKDEVSGILRITNTSNKTLPVKLFDSMFGHFQTNYGNDSRLRIDYLDFTSKQDSYLQLLLHTAILPVVIDRWMIEVSKPEQFGETICINTQDMHGIVRSESINLSDYQTPDTSNHFIRFTSQIYFNSTTYMSFNMLPTSKIDITINP